MLKNYFLLKSFLFSVFFFPLLLSAEEYDLQKSIKTALEKSHDIEHSEYSIKIEEQELRKYYSSVYPQIRFNASSRYNIELTKTLIPAVFTNPDAPPGEVIPIAFGTEYDLSGSLSLEQAIFNYAAFKGVNIGKNYLELKKIDHEKVKEEVLSNVYTVYYQALLVTEQEKIVRELAQMTDSLYNDTKKYYSQGLIDEVELLKVELEKNKSVSVVSNIEKMKTIVKERFKQVVGIEKNEKVSFSNVLKGEFDEAEIKSLFSENGTPISKLSDYQKIGLGIEILNELEGVNKSEYLPKLFFIGGINLTAGANTLGEIFKVSERWFPGYYVGLKLSLNVFDGLKREAEIRKTRYTKMQSEIEKEKYETSVSIQIGNLRSELENAYNEYKDVLQNVELSKKIFAITKKKFKNGVASVSNILQTKSTLNQVKLDSQTKLFSLLIKRVELLKTLGKLKSNYE